MGIQRRIDSTIELVLPIGAAAPLAFQAERRKMYPPSLSYMVCSTPRSGSNLLCELAIQTGRLGIPDENLGKAPVMREFAERHGLLRASSIEIVRRFIETTQTQNGVFGFKAHLAYFEALRREVSISEVLPQLKHIYLDRRDNLMQAISLTRAIVTRHWSTLHSSTNAKPSYSADGICASLRSLLADKAQWETYFALAGVSPLRILYEDLVEDPNREFSRISETFGIDLPPVAINAVALRIQRDAESEDWRARLIEDARPQFVGGPEVLRQLALPSTERRRRL